jgi:cell division protein FtsL
MKAAAFFGAGPRLAHALSLRPSTAVRQNELGVVAALLCGAGMVLLALMFLAWVRTSSLQTGYELHDLRTDVLRLRHERTALVLEVQTLKRPERLDAIAREKLSLFPPSPRRTVTLDDDAGIAAGAALAGGLP